ncbi:uncharacterized protein MELLADRAFT_95640 [Melampsora larici-populina 98AG31]|uniref:Uncharacterized protein n=1 Tax=Melampsora larici-populina (strain 98AG31 / pathotype 3-4-7) TaxID=747676 RepID=F4SA21_MELLP|nr:uncharacterized protein MELLADRAFT_95640 [Melampsora larici-populina 98AG31]EGF98514.1 hypothetical protein MELLADRAFT_95640 [Melampsora larici-populina 98AG31]
MSDLAPMNFVFSYENRHLIAHKPPCLDTAKTEVKDLFNLSLEPKLINFHACLHHLGCDHRSLLAEVTPSSWPGLGPNTHLIITQSSNVISSSSTTRPDSDSQPISRSASSSGRTMLISEEATFKTTQVATKTKHKKALTDEQFYHENVKQNVSPIPLPRKPLHISSLKKLPANPRSLLDRREKPVPKPIEDKPRSPLISPQARVPLSPLKPNTYLVDVSVGRTPDSPSLPHSEPPLEISVRPEAEQEDQNLDQGTRLQDQPVQESQSQPENWDNLQLMLDSLLAISPTSESPAPFLPPLLDHPLELPYFNQDDSDDDEQVEIFSHQNENVTVQVETDDTAPLKPLDKEVQGTYIEALTRRLTVTPVSLSAPSSPSYYFTLESPAQGLGYDPSHLTNSPVPMPTHGLEIPEKLFGLKSPYELEDENQFVVEKLIPENPETRPQVTTEKAAESYHEGNPKLEGLEQLSSAKLALMKLRARKREQEQSDSQIISISHRGLTVESKTSEDQVLEDIQCMDVLPTEETSVTTASDPLILADTAEFGPSRQNNTIETVDADHVEETEPRAKISEKLSQKQLLRLLLIPKGQIQLSVFSTNTNSPAPKFSVTIDQSRSVIDLMAYISSQPEFSDESEYHSLWLQDPDGNTEREISKQGTIKEAKLQTGDRLRFGTRAKSTRRKTRMSVMSKLFKEEDEAMLPMTPQMRDETEKSLTRPGVAIRKRGTLNISSISRRSGLPGSPARLGSSRIPPGSVKPSVNLSK